LDRINKLYRPLLLLARPYWPHLAGILALSVIAAPVSLLLALPLKIAVDNVIGNQPLPHILRNFLPALLESSKGAEILLAVGILMTLSLIMNLQAFVSWLL